MVFYLIYFDCDNTWDILPENLIKSERSLTCKVFYKTVEAKGGARAYAGLIEHKGEEEECMEMAKKFHPWFFNQQNSKQFILN